MFWTCILSKFPSSTELTTPINGVWKPIKDYPAIHQTFSCFLINLEVRDDTPISCFIQDFLEPDSGQMTNEVLKKRNRIH